MNDNECNDLRHALQVALLDGVNVHRSKEGDCVLQLPFLDRSGDPIDVMIRHQENIVTLDDGGIIAGDFFSLGQQSTDSPAFKLLRNLSKAYDFEIDFDRGIVTFDTSGMGVVERVMDLLKVIITITTAVPFIRVSPNRPLVGGQRLRTRIKKAYKEQQILDLVQPNLKLDGVSVDSWPIDFHWQIQTSEQSKDVYIVALDLQVEEPLQKAERVAGLALDTRSTIGENFLRIVIDKSYIRDPVADSAASIAARFLTVHKDTLRYELYDFGQEDERQYFVRQSVNELMGDMGQAWRELWSQTKPQTSRMMTQLSDAE